MSRMSIYMGSGIVHWVEFFSFFTLYLKNSKDELSMLLTNYGSTVTVGQNDKR